MLNCTDAESTCAEEGILGVGGVCDAVSGLCECLAGYSGRDDWQRFNDCSVNESLQDGIHWALFALSGMVFVVSLGGLVYLLQHWNYGPGVLMRKMSNLSLTASKGEEASSFSGTPSAAPQSPHQQSRVRRNATQLKKRQQKTFVVMLLFIGFSVGNMSYTAGFLFFDKHRFDRSALQDAGLALATGTVLISLWILFHVFASSLPNIKLYTKLFKVDSFLIRREKFVRWSGLARAGFIGVFMITILVVYPYALSDNSDETRELLDKIYLSVSAVVIVDFAIFALILSTLLIRLYGSLKQMSTEATEIGMSGFSVDAFDRALSTIRVVAYAVACLAPAASILFFIVAFAPGVRVYLLFNTIIGIGILASFVVLWVFIRRLAGQKTPNTPRPRGSSAGDMAAKLAVRPLSL